MKPVTLKDVREALKTDFPSTDFVVGRIKAKEIKVRWTDGVSKDQVFDSLKRYLSTPWVIGLDFIDCDRRLSPEVQIQFATMICEHYGLEMDKYFSIRPDDGGIVPKSRSAVGFEFFKMWEGYDLTNPHWEFGQGKVVEDWIRAYEAKHA